MKNLIYILILISFTISCSKESVEPETELIEKLEQYLVTSQKAVILDDAILNPDFELPSEKLLVGNLSFEILDYSIIPGIEQIFKDLGFTNFNLDAQLEFLSQNSLNRRIQIGQCQTTWTFSIYPNGQVFVMVCSTCDSDDGSWECMGTFQ